MPPARCNSSPRARSTFMPPTKPATRSSSTSISGARVDSIETSKLSLKFMNEQTDRLYLAAPDGLVQCLHEIGIKEPLRYDLDAKASGGSGGSGQTGGR